LTGFWSDAPRLFELATVIAEELEQSAVTESIRVDLGHCMSDLLPAVRWRGEPM
jgi:hypothetical protein